MTLKQSQQCCGFHHDLYGSAPSDLIVIVLCLVILIIHMDITHLCSLHQP